MAAIGYPNLNAGSPEKFMEKNIGCNWSDTAIW
jgi:hypothetical protein